MENLQKENIKGAAKKLFFQFGYSKTSMDDIARESKLAKPTLYYYYPNKGALFNQIVIDEAEKLMNQVQNQVPADLPADKKMAAFFQAVYDHLNQFEKEITHLPKRMYKDSPHGQPIIEKITELMKKQISPILQAGIQENIFDIEKREDTLLAILAMTRFLNMEWIHQTPKKTRDKILHHVIQLILYGLIKR
ncbi:MAG: hypothetical protein Kow0042_16860 [Calditrichia bacterium]